MRDQMDNMDKYLFIWTPKILVNLDEFGRSSVVFYPFNCQLSCKPSQISCFHQYFLKKTSHFNRNRGLKQIKMPCPKRFCPKFVADVKFGQRFCKKIVVHVKFGQKFRNESSLQNMRPLFLLKKTFFFHSYFVGRGGAGGRGGDRGGGGSEGEGQVSML